MKPSHKFCPMCELDLPAKAFARMDKNAVCKTCQRAGETFTGDTTPGTAQTVPARVRANRRNGKDNRE